MKSPFVRRTGLILSFVLALCIVLAYSAKAMAAPDDSKVYTRITSQELYDIMKEHGCDVKYDEDEDDVEDDTSLVWRIDGKRTIILFYDGGTALQLYCVYVDTNVTTEDANDWNMTHRFSRAYLDDDGDPCLEVDLDLAGGVTRARIKDYLDTCTVAVYTWKTEYIN